MIKLALNPDTTPLAVADVLVFKSLEARAREAAQAGFEFVNVDRSEENLTPAEAREILQRHGLKVASAFFQGDLHDPRQEEAILERARQQAEFSSQLGQDCLFVSSTVCPPERFAVAGHVQPGVSPELSQKEFLQMARLLERIADLWRRHGIRLCYHPHVATYVETPAEIDRLMSLSDPQRVLLGADTGHIYYGGGDPLALIEKYFDRLGALHIKDVDAGAVKQARKEGMNYQEACGAGIWTEIGSGIIDFRALFELLQSRHWSGWVIVETDHTRLPTALESSRKSREYLKRVIGT